MGTSEAQRRAAQKYKKANTRQISFCFSNIYDADIISKLDAVESKQGYIKDLIRADIARANSGKKEEEKKMSKEISLDNGMHYMSAAEAAEEIRRKEAEDGWPAKRQWEAIYNMMDAKLCEIVHEELAPCTDEEFLARYLELSPDDLTIG